MFRFNLYLLFIFITFCGNATSLFEEASFKALHADKKAYRIGDGITILVYQSVQANSSAGEGSSGEFNFNGSAGVDERRWGADLNLGSSNNGDAATNRNGFVRAQLTAVVVSKDENDTLTIAGSQKITVNEELQLITVKGRVRAEDISNENTVPSYRIHNAELSINGEGAVTKGKDGNVFTRFAEWLGL